eukprot:COSAG01_NODE_1873_length_8995_cov_7.542299_12_plen_119_part_00
MGSKSIVPLTCSLMLQPPHQPACVAVGGLATASGGDRRPLARQAIAKAASSTSSITTAIITIGRSTRSRITQSSSAAAATTIPRQACPFDDILRQCGGCSPLWYHQAEAATGRGLAVS